MTNNDDPFDRALEGLTCSGPVTEEQIVRAEVALGVKFPPSYRIFLERYGASLGKAPYELAVLPQELKPDETPLYTSVVYLTSAARRASRGSFPARYVMVSDDGLGETYCIDTSVSNADGESPVVAVGPRRITVVATSFRQFALKALTEGAV